MQTNKPFGLSIAITAKDEREYLSRLLCRLFSFDYGDIPVEIVLQLDSTYPKHKAIETNATQLRNLSWMETASAPELKVVECPFQGHFGEFKTNLHNHCKYSWIFQLDADEYPSDALLISILHLITYGDSDPEVDAIAIPRLNRVVGLSEQHVEKWKWNLTHAPTVVGHPPLLNEVQAGEDLNPQLTCYVDLYKKAGGAAVVGPFTLFVDTVAVNWPDWQVRAYRNREDLVWTGKVHERLSTDKIIQLTDNIQLGCYLIHDKYIQRQERQNSLYESL